MRSAAAAGALLLVVACGSSEGEGSATSAPPTAVSPSTRATSSSPSPERPISAPARAVDALMRALDDGNCATAKRLVVTPTELGCDVVQQAQGSFADEGIDLDRVVYRSGAVIDDSATVTIDWGNGNPSESYDVQRVDGRWKVVFDSAA